MCNEIDKSLREVLGEQIRMLCKTAERLAAENAELCREWTSVDDRVPKGNDNVIVLTGQTAKKVTAGYHFDNRWWTLKDTLFYYEVTHWMPLPAAPEEVRA